jgi:hypothetical protein
MPGWHHACLHGDFSILDAADANNNNKKLPAQPVHVHMHV